MTKLEQMGEIAEVVLDNLHECACNFDEEGGEAAFFHSLQRAKLFAEATDGLFFIINETE